MKPIIRFFVFALCGALITAAFMHKPRVTAARQPSPQEHPSSIRHLACIMDGNRRWAQERGLEPWLGHRQGVQTVRMVIDFCCEQQIPELSLYVWSLENFKRSLTEQEYLFSTLAAELANTINAELIDKGVRLRVIGDRARFPAAVRDIIADAEHKTAGGETLTLNLLFCYGGQQEIVTAAQSLARAAQSGILDPEKITSELFTQQLWSGCTTPPDIIIRTGKRRSLSNFYTYLSAYSEIYFLDCYWPDLTREQLLETVTQLSTTVRKYGA